METAGRRNRRITFQVRAAAGDGMGNAEGGWIDLCGPMWARVRPLNGREEVLAQRLAGVTPFEITVLSTSASRQITAACRAIDVRTAETFDLTEDPRNPDERNYELAMTAKKGTADG